MKPSCVFQVVLIFLALEDTTHLVVCEDNPDIFEYYYVDGDNTTSEKVADDAEDAEAAEEYDDEEYTDDKSADFVYQDETTDVKFTPEGYSNGKGDYEGMLRSKNFTKNAEIVYSDKLYNTSKLSDPVQNLVKDSTKRALSEFKADEDLYNNPKFFKGFYKKWTPESVAAGKDARLLDTAISSLENRSRTAGSDYASGDYGTAEELQNVTKVDKIKLILNELLTLADTEPGQDYQDNGSDEEKPSKHTAQSCQKNSEIRCQPSSKYRAESGECNNLQNSLWGKANSAQTRLFPDLVNYEDGIGSPTSTVILKGQDRIYLPNARLVSKRIHENKRERNIPSKKITHMAMQFGQFLDHELTLTPEPELECCAPEIINKSRCFPIRLDGKGMIDMETDEIHLLSKPRKHQNCIAFSRSDPACDTGTGNSVRQQLNSLTGFIDGSAIYGSSAALTNHLRWKKKNWRFLGFLQVNPGNYKDLPTRTQVGEGGNFAKTEGHLKISGDQRVVEHPGLAVMHTLWVNEHNRIAHYLRKQPPIQDYMFEKKMDIKARDEFLFQETRRILEAELQLVVYSEFLPVVLGPAMMEEFDLFLNITDTKYDDNLNPSIINEFSTVSMRFGHSLVGTQFTTTERRRKTKKMFSFDLSNAFFNNELMNCANTTCQDDEDLTGSCTNRTCTYWADNVLFGLLNIPAQADDAFLNTDLINNLFLSKEVRSFEKNQKEKAESSDLSARNIQRGRDHGLPRYKEFRKQNKIFPLKNLGSFGFKACSVCMKSVPNKQREFYCSPYHLPDRDCEACLEFSNFKKFNDAFQEDNTHLCSYCVRRKCSEKCAPLEDNVKRNNLNKCGNCFQKQIVALHSCDAPYSDTAFMRKKCKCKECIDKETEKARKLKESDLGIRTEDFVRIGETYCWHLDSVDAFTGAIAEISVDGGITGPTNSAILAEQFRRLKFGDRFFFTHGYRLTGKREKGLELIAKSQVLKQSMASILCNNLKSYTIPVRDKKKWRMLEFPFKVGSRWLSCTKILRDAAMDFKTMAREIVNSRQRIESKCKQGNGRNAKCNECTNDDDCLDEYNEDYECVENECLLKSFTCFDNFDCDVNERCVDEFCVKRRNNRGRGRRGREGRGGRGGGGGGGGRGGGGRGGRG